MDTRPKPRHQGLSPLIRTAQTWVPTRSHRDPRPPGGPRPGPRAHAWWVPRDGQPEPRSETEPLTTAASNRSNRLGLRPVASRSGGA